MDFLESFDFIKYSVLFFLIIFLPKSIYPKQTHLHQEPNPKLPFEISPKKKLSTEDIQSKKEGWYFNLLPLANTDPNQGIGYGLRTAILNNGSSKDTLFGYTPYRFRASGLIFKSSKNLTIYGLIIDMPYIFDSPYRLRIQGFFVNNPNSLYFGIGEKTLQPLSYKQRNDPTGETVHEGNFLEREKQLSYSQPSSNGISYRVMDKKYNYYELENTFSTLSLERNYFKGLVRLAGGFKFARNIIHFFDGKIFPARETLYNDIPTKNDKTKVTEDYESKEIKGIGGGYTNTIRFAFVYDTRDLEPDPYKGNFFELTHERAIKSIGSDFQFNKTFFQYRLYYPIFPKYIQRMLIAYRFGIVSTRGKDIPFYEYRNFYGTEGEMGGLGGMRTLRGFRQDRFVAPAMGFYNLELRYKFYELHFKQENFLFYIVPFVDSGRVWNDMSRINLQGYMYSYGIGLRIAWNQATVMMADYAVSKEDKQLYVNFNHIF